MVLISSWSDSRYPKLLCYKRQK